MRNVTARICGDPPAWRAGVNVDCEDARAEAQEEQELELRRRSGLGNESSLARAQALAARRWGQVGYATPAAT